jgi:hypothetical protein
MTERTVSEELARLVEQREKANARVGELEAEARAAQQAAIDASEELAQLERRGGPAAKRREVEQRLAVARGKAAEPWDERVKGARLRVADAQHAVQAFAADSFDELAEALEEVGAAFAAELNAHADGVVRAYRDWQRVSTEIGQLASLAGGRARPGDVSRTQPASDQMFVAAETLLRDGGEAGPRLRRDPREPVLGAPAAEAEPVPA